MLKRITDGEIEKAFKRLTIFASNPEMQRLAEANIIADAQLASCEAQLQEILAEERKGIGEWLDGLCKITGLWRSKCPHCMGKLFNALKKGELPEEVK